jgi:hypothetical protein
MATIESTTEIRPFSVDFAAWQEPELFPNELAAAFKSLRDERRSS